MPLRDLVQQVLDVARDSAARRPVVAVDGRSSSGKSTLAQRIEGILPGTSVVHTDDVAWHQSCFDWPDFLIDGVLRPLQVGQPVRYRPPSWDARGRPGSIDVPVESSLVVVEGVGAARAEAMPFLDAVVYVQVDLAVAAQRNLVKVKADEISRTDFEAWMAEEIPFVAKHRPWERADFVVAGSAVSVVPSASEVAVVDGRRPQ
jgi:uridine kinase